MDTTEQHYCRDLINGPTIGRGERENVCDWCEDGFRIFQCIHCLITLCYDCVNNHTH